MSRHHTTVLTPVFVIVPAYRISYLPSLFFVLHLAVSLSGFLMISAALFSVRGILYVFKVAVTFEKWFGSPLVTTLSGVSLPLFASK